MYSLEYSLIYQGHFGFLERHHLVKHDIVDYHETHTNVPLSSFNKRITKTNSHKTILSKPTVIPPWTLNLQQWTIYMSYYAYFIIVLYSKQKVNANGVKYNTIKYITIFQILWDFIRDLLRIFKKQLVSTYYRFAVWIMQPNRSFLNILLFLKVHLSSGHMCRSTTPLSTYRDAFYLIVIWLKLVISKTVSRDWLHSVSDESMCI